MASFRKCAKAHVLPIARIVHEWATGEVPGPDWGVRPYKKIKPHLDALTWPEWSDEERTPLPLPPPPPHDPGVMERRMDRLKASLKAKSGELVK